VEIYLKVFEDKIVEVETENIDENYVKMNIKDMDEFYIKIHKYGKLEEDIEEKVKELFETGNEGDSLSAFNIKHWVSNRSFGELIDMYENDEIIKPDMQREFVWDSLKCSRLIESIILGLPIPPLFLLEVGKNQYELIDGFQRLTTIMNYVKGNPWHGELGPKRMVKAKLSSKVSKEIQGKTFSNLDPEYKRIIKRSTIPLIEFKQLEPDNFNSKYLIFERINTGSEKLNPMQIRKALTHGNFIKELYEMANSNLEFKGLFSTSNIKKDQHVEALLRIIAMTDIYYKELNVHKPGINNILNEYCEDNCEKKVDGKYLEKFNNAISFAYQIFCSSDKMFRRIERDKNGEYVVAGNLNVSIMEAFIGTLIERTQYIQKDESIIYKNYCKIMHNTLEKSLTKEKENPFTTSTGSLKSLENRFSLCKDILEN